MEQKNEQKNEQKEGMKEKGVRSAVAGCFGGAVTTTLLSPIDVARSRIMVQVK